MILTQVLLALRELSLVKVSGILLFSYMIWSNISSWYRLRHFPGPFLGRFSYLWMIQTWVSKQQGEAYKGVNKQYKSPLVRIGPNELMTDDPDIIRYMNGVRSGYARSDWYYSQRLDPYRRGLFDNHDTAAHDKLRAKVAHSYTLGKENPSMEADIDEQVRELIRLIQRKYITKDADGPCNPIDMAATIQYLTLDSFTKLAYGKPFGFLATDSDVYSYIENIEGVSPMITLATDYPLLGKILFHPWILSLIGPKTTDQKGVGVMLRIAKEVVAERFSDEDDSSYTPTATITTKQPNSEDPKKKNKKKLDMLSAFIKHGCTRAECETEVPFQLVAGSDTTATAIRSTLLHLAANRQAYDRLQREIDAAVADGRVPSEGEGIVKAEKAKQLPYLQAVVYEGLRMQVPFTGLLMKEVPRQGDNISGMWVPGGVRIGHNSVGVQRREDIFGKDVEMFRPERWLLGGSPEADAKKAQMVQATELVFGYGRWQCLGKPIAYMEMHKVYVELLRRFDFQTLYPKKPWRTSNRCLHLQSELWMKVTERFPADPDV